jgi:hypothetical protein
VELSLQHRVLRRTHELLSEYAALPVWPEVWADASKAAALADGEPRRSAIGDAALLGVADMLPDAVFDSQRQVLLAPWAEAQPDAAALAGPGSGEVEGRISALLAPYRSFFGRQHLAALLEVEGDWAMAALLEAALDRFEESQVGVGGLILRS